ncbi:MAG: 6-phosphogluconolactonase [Candidatus Anoxychlamydiales bacterium]|nr:6-phosphogluconolactonase [Candidatus Anoxychlamydiales bacterium]
MRTIKVFDEIEDLNYFLFDLIKNISVQAIEKKGFFSLALSGGSTPLNFYDYLASKKHLDWEKFHVFFVDERLVSDLNEISNIYQINKRLIKPLNLKKEQIHYINKEIDPEDAQNEYELEIKDSLSHEEHPSFDLILLGIGKDGHTASLFPNTDILHEKEKLISLVQKEDEEFERLSFTYPLINNAKNVLFLALGENKASIIKKVLIDKDGKYPAQHIKAKENLYFILDKKAAKFIDL